MTDHEARAREICSPEYFGGVRANDAQHVADVAEALRTVELEAYERAAKVADEMYGTVPLSRESVCDTIAQAIRDLAVKEGEG
jgi:hypothetical protein